MECIGDDQVSAVELAPNLFVTSALTAAADINATILSNEALYNNQNEIDNFEIETVNASYFALPNSFELTNQEISKVEEMTKAVREKLEALRNATEELKDLNYDDGSECKHKSFWGGSVCEGRRLFWQGGYVGGGLVVVVLGYVGYKYRRRIRGVVGAKSAGIRVRF